MHLVSVSELAKSYDGRTLFDGVSFGLSSGDRVGVVGRNGSGKSTLLRLVAGLEQPDAGTVVTNNAARIGYLAQSAEQAGSATVRQLAAPDDDPTVRRHEVEAILDRLGLDPDRRVVELSGGQRRRAALAAALLPDRELLVLDEPTNHLDAGTIDWLEGVLLERNVALLMVTHDRYFLERLTNRMIELDRGHAYWHEGTYSDVLEARAERAELAATAEQRRRNLLRKEVAWLRRGPKARTSKPKFRLQQVEALRRAAPEPDQAQLELGTGRRRLGSDVVDLVDVGFRYPAGTEVLRGVDLAIGPGQRVGIVGPNGSGKTTLLALIAGRLTPTSGQVRIGRTVEIGYYTQDATVPAADRTVLDSITDIAAWIPLATGERLPASSLAQRFGFDDRLQRAPIATLSGGERRRLALLHTLVRAPNLLLLDEPTNDLDLDTLRVLEDHLDGFRGTLIVASHDRYLLDRLTDVIHGLEPDRTIGTYRDAEHYHEVRVDEERRQREAAERDRPDRERSSAARNRERQARMREQRSLEGRLHRLESERDRLHHELAEHATDPGALARLHAELEQVDRELAQVEDAWLELAVD